MKKANLIFLVLVAFVFLVASTVVNAANWKVIYSEDFSSDPSWTTDQPTNFYWESESETYFIRENNTPPGGDEPTRYTYKLITPYSGGSFKLEWDLEMLRSDWSAGINIGMFDDHKTYYEIDGSACVGVEYVNADPGPEFAVRVHQDTNMVTSTNPTDFALNVWYHNVLVYDSQARTVQWTVYVRGESTPLMVNTLTNAPIITNDIIYLGASRAFFSYASAVAEARLDNVALSVVSENNDSDGDGILDDEDNCPESDLKETVVIDGCNSGVSNTLFDDGCTMSDLIAQCAEGVKNHGQFVSCVAHLTNGWKRNKLISGREKGAIQSCAAKSDIPNDTCPQTTVPAPLPRTGQTICFDASGNQRNCNGTGEDGEYQKGVVSPNPRFTDNGNGTVTDNLTGLMWTKDAQQIPGLMNWQDALDACNNSVFAEYDDWRLPNVRELLSLMDYDRQSPTLPQENPFVNEPSSSLYWSSTTYILIPSYAWLVSFGTGSLDADQGVKSNSLSVRAVRGGH